MNTDFNMTDTQRMITADYLKAVEDFVTKIKSVREDARNKGQVRMPIYNEQGEQVSPAANILMEKIYRQTSLLINMLDR